MRVAVTPSTSCDKATTQAVEINEEITQVRWNVVTLRENLTTEQTEQFFIYFYDFATSDTDFERTKKTRHKINTSDTHQYTKECDDYPLTREQKYKLYSKKC